MRFSHHRDQQFTGWFLGETHRDGTVHAHSRCLRFRNRDRSRFCLRCVWFPSRILAFIWTSWWSTATGSRDSGSMDENRKMRRELETSLDDEHLRSAVLLRFPRAQSRARVFRLALQRIFRFRERLWCQMQERQLVGLNCLCDKSHAPNSSWNNTKIMRTVHSQQCHFPENSYTPCPPVQVGGVS